MSFRQKSNYFTGKKNTLFVQQLFRYMSLWQKFNNLTEKKNTFFVKQLFRLNYLICCKYFCNASKFHDVFYLFFTLGFLCPKFYACHPAILIPRCKFLPVSSVSMFWRKINVNKYFFSITF